MGTTLLLQNLFCSGTSSPYQLFYTRASQSTESQLHPWFVNGMYPCTACVLHCSANTTHNYYTTAQTVLSVLVGRFTVKQMSWGGQQPAYDPNYQAHGQRPPMQGYHPSQPPPHQMSYGAPQHGYGAPPPQYNPQQYPAATGQQPGYQQPGYQQPGMPPGADPTLWHWFQAVDADHSGSISATELRQALVNGNWSHFNEETCRLMIGMFDKDRNGTINFSEFAALWKYIQDWKSCFERFDQDRSGNIDANELHHALKSFGYNVTPGFCSVLVQKFDRSDMRTMKLDDFIQCCVMIRSLTEAFKKKDAAARGIVRICYEDFLEMVLENAIH